MRVEYAKCDACKETLGEGDSAHERWLEIRSAFTSRGLDICRECWQKMCAAVNLDPSLRP